MVDQVKMIRAFCLDLGNTCTKWALIDVAEDRREWLHHGVFDSVLLQTDKALEMVLSDVLNRDVMQVDVIAVACVQGVSMLQRCVDWASSQGLPIVLSKPDLQVQRRDWPLGTCYTNPETLGQDRWAAALAVVGATTQDVNVLVSFGTATTVDVVVRGALLAQPDYSFVHGGGYIVPGVQLMLNSLHGHTAALPLLQANQPTWIHPMAEGQGGSRVKWPCNTVDAIGQGVWTMQFDWISAIRRQLVLQFQQPVALWLCGGLAGDFDAYFDAPCQRLEQAVLLGLAEMVGRLQPLDGNTGGCGV